MVNHRGKITLGMFALAIITVLLLPNVLGIVFGTVFIVLSLALWTIPRPQAGHDATDASPTLGRASQIMLGLGLGLMASVAYIFLPPQLAWVVIGAVAIGVLAYVARLFRQ